METHPPHNNPLRLGNENEKLEILLGDEIWSIYNSRDSDIIIQRLISFLNSLHNLKEFRRSKQFASKNCCPEDRGILA